MKWYRRERWLSAAETREGADEGVLGWEHARHPDRGPDQRRGYRDPERGHRWAPNRGLRTEGEARDQHAGRRKCPARAKPPTGLPSPPPGSGGAAAGPSPARSGPGRSKSRRPSPQGWGQGALILGGRPGAGGGV